MLVSGILRRARVVALVTAAAMCGSTVLALGAAAATGTAPPWEPDPNSAAPYGGLVFYDSAGHVLTSGGNLAHLFDYAAATSAPDAGADKATLYFANPSTTLNISSWYSVQESASTYFPNSSAPPPIQGPGFTYPLVTLGATDGDLQAFLGGATKDPTAGYANTVEVRVYDSGPFGITSGSHYWSAALAYNTGSSTITVQGVSVPPGSWAQLYPTVTTTSLTATPNPAAVGKKVTFTAKVNPTDGAGTVAFSSNGTTLSGCGAVALVAVSGVYQATCSAAFQAIGTYSVRAAYSGDPAYAASSATLAEKVVAASTTTKVTSSLNPSTVGAPVTFTAKVSPTDGLGTVSFTDGTTAIAGCSGLALTKTSAGYTAKCTTSALTAGTHTIKGSYSGDTNYKASSGTVSQVVN